MKAIVQDRYGPPDVLALADIDKPAPRDNEVLLRVDAAGVGPDVWHLMTGEPYVARVALGLRRPKVRVRGWDVAGRVEAVGKNVTGVKPGDEVFGVCEGSFAEYACAQVDKIASRPANLTPEQAAAVPISGVTALQALRDKGRLQPGQKVLVIGAGGGVGTLAVQLAKAFGAEVTGVCGPTKTDLVTSLGADEVVDYTGGDGFLDGSRRYDLIVDTAGNRRLAHLRRALTPKGALVIVVAEGAGRWFGLGRQLRGQLLTPFVGQGLGMFVAITRREDLESLRDFIEAGKLTPVVGRTYALSDAAEAVRQLARGHSRGKAVITV
jgi:NADPH:quinone reductase-like Zn-dependent oxidoreductase